MQSERMTARVQIETRRRLERILMQNEAAVRGELANLRRGVGRAPGDLPALWGMLFDQLPDDMLGQYAQPSRAEWAIYAAVTLYALHQQGKDPQRESMNQQGVSLGRAAAILVWKEGEGARERIARRFHQVALSPDMEGLTYYLRGFVQLLRSEGVALDYPLLAADLYRFQFPEQAPSVRLKWGQDFYARKEDAQEADAADENE